VKECHIPLTMRQKMQAADMMIVVCEVDCVCVMCSIESTVMVSCLVPMLNVLK
jgi:hypothetical protein